MPREQLVNEGPSRSCSHSSFEYLPRPCLPKIFCQVIRKYTLKYTQGVPILKELFWLYYSPGQNFALSTDKSPKPLGWNFRFSKIKSLFNLSGLSFVLFCNPETPTKQNSQYSLHTLGIFWPQDFADLFHHFPTIFPASEVQSGVMFIKNHREEDGPRTSVGVG